MKDLLEILAAMAAKKPEVENPRDLYLDMAERMVKSASVAFGAKTDEVAILVVTTDGKHLRFVAPRKVGENEQLYGSVTSGDIAEFLKGKGIEVDRRKVQLEEPIKRLGEHEVKVKLHPEVAASLRVLVTKEG